MKCRDVQNNLFAWIDGDVSEQKRLSIEEHLKSCKACGTALEETKLTKGKLLLLRELPPLPEITEAVIKEKAGKTTQTGFRKLLRPAAIAVPVMIILAVFLSLQFTGVFGGASSIIAKAYAATDGLYSFRCELDEIQQGETLEDTPYVLHSLSEYSAPDRFHVTADIEIKVPGYIPSSIAYFVELISIGETGYIYLHDSHLYFTPDKDWFTRMIPSKEESLELLNLLTEIRTLDDETIDGEPCYHYSGSVDMEKYREWRIPQLEKAYYRVKAYYQDMSAFIESQLQNMGDEMFMELWIGKSDYIVRKTIVNRSDSSTSETRFYDCNEEIIIEPPLDENGELLTRWIVNPLLD